MGRTACTEPQCLYKGTLYLYLLTDLYLRIPWERVADPLESVEHILGTAGLKNI